MATKIVSRNVTTTPAPKAKTMKNVGSSLKDIGKTPPVKFGELIKGGFGLETILPAIERNTPEVFALFKNTPPAISVRDDGRAVVSLDVRLTVRLALNLLRLNVENRDLRWNHVGTLGHTLRLDMAAPDAWRDDVSTILIATLDQATARELACGPFKIGDGQHRLMGFVVAFGSYRDIQEMQHLHHVATFNRAIIGTEDKPKSFDFVDLDEASPAIVRADGTLTKRPTLAEWLDTVERSWEKDNQESPHCYALPIAKWEFATPHTHPEKPFWFGLRIGVSPDVYGVADQNVAPRDGADFIAQDRNLGNVLSANALPAKTAAMLTRTVGIRYKVPTIVKDENQNDVTKRGLLSDGAKWKSPPSFPSWFNALRGQIVPAWNAYNAVIDAMYTPGEDEDGNPVAFQNLSYPASAKHKAHPAYKLATRPVQVMGSTEGEDGRKLPDNIVLFALCLIDRNRYATETEYMAELADIAHRLRHGVYSDGKEWKADKTFGDVRSWYAEIVGRGGVAKPDAILARIANAWNNERSPSRDANRAIGRIPERFAGMDAHGLTPDICQLVGEHHPLLPKRAPGRPAGTGKKKKA